MWWEHIAKRMKIVLVFFYFLLLLDSMMLLCVYVQEKSCFVLITEKILSTRSQTLYLSSFSKNQLKPVVTTVLPSNLCTMLAACSASSLGKGLLYPCVILPQLCWSFSNLNTVSFSLYHIFCNLWVNRMLF